MPSLDRMGEVDLFLLSLIDRSNTLEEIAHQAAERFPDYFKTWKNTLTRSSELSKKIAVNNYLIFLKLEINLSYLNVGKIIKNDKVSG